jgi:hypothetical protein
MTSLNSHLPAVDRGRAPGSRTFQRNALIGALTYRNER